MQNEIANWNCQGMEALETLHEDDLVDQYDYDQAYDALIDLYHD